MGVNHAAAQALPNTQSYVRCDTSINTHHCSASLGNHLITPSTADSLKSRTVTSLSIRTASYTKLILGSASRPSPRVFGMQTPGPNSTKSKMIQSRMIQEEGMLCHSPNLLVRHTGRAKTGGSLKKDSKGNLFHGVADATTPHSVIFCQWNCSRISLPCLMVD